MGATLELIQPLTSDRVQAVDDPDAGYTAAIQTHAMLLNRQRGSDRLSREAKRILDDVVRTLQTRPAKWGTYGGSPCAQLAPELVVNGDGSSGTTPWSGTISIVGGAFELDASSQYETFGQGVATVAGQTYLLSFWSKLGTSTAVQIRLKNSAFGDISDVTWLKGGSHTSEWTEHQALVVAEDSLTRLYPLQNISAALGTSYARDISFHLATAQPGETPWDHVVELAAFHSAANVGSGYSWTAIKGADFTDPSASLAQDSALNGVDQYLLAPLVKTLAHDAAGVGFTAIMVGDPPTGTDSVEAWFGLTSTDASDSQTEKAFMVARSGTTANMAIWRYALPDPRLNSSSVGAPTGYLALAFENGTLTYASGAGNGTHSYGNTNDVQATGIFIGARKTSGAIASYGDPKPLFFVLIEKPLPLAQLQTIGAALANARTQLEAL